MKKFLAMTTAALMSASVLAAPAFAQSSETPGVDEGTTAAIDESEGGNGSFTAITGSASATQSIANMTDFGSVTVNRITGEESGQLDLMVSENRQSIDALHAAIASNAAVQGELQAQGVNPANIVGAEVAANGDLVLYSM
jgi:hypothetical protein